MKFTIINSEKESLENRGYKFAKGSKRVTDYGVLEKIEKLKGEDYAEELTERFIKEQEPICQGEDGEFYCVLFDGVPDEGTAPSVKAVMWQAVSVATVLNFTIINSEKKPLEDRGYRFADGSKRILNYTALEKITVEKGEEYADSLTARFLKELEPICMGEDGVFYYVLFHDLGEKGDDSISQGIMWQEVSVLNILNNDGTEDASGL